MSDVKFITFKVCYNCINYDIELSKKNQYNFYIVNNIINKAFIIYYFRKFLNIYVDDIEYDAVIIDFDVNIVSFTDKDCILINKEYYKLIKKELDKVVRNNNENVKTEEDENEPNVEIVEDANEPNVEDVDEHVEDVDEDDENIINIEINSR